VLAAVANINGREPRYDRACVVYHYNKNFGSGFEAIFVFT
jgi:hypothetical protein